MQQLEQTVRITGRIDQAANVTIGNLFEVIERVTNSGYRLQGLSSRVERGIGAVLGDGSGGELQDVLRRTLPEARFDLLVLKGDGLLIDFHTSVEPTVEEAFEIEGVSNLVVEELLGIQDEGRCHVVMMAGDRYEVLDPNGTKPPKYVIDSSAPKQAIRKLCAQCLPQEDAWRFRISQVQMPNEPLDSPIHKHYPNAVPHYGVVVEWHQRSNRSLDQQPMPSASVPSLNSKA